MVTWRNNPEQRTARTTRFNATGSGPAELFNDLVQDFVKELFGRIIERTPVESGRFVNNWNFSTDLPELGITESAGSKASKKSELDAFAKTLHSGGRIYMSNGLDYAYRLETGWSGQSPTGMVQITAIEAEDVLAEAKLKAGL